MQESNRSPLLPDRHPQKDLFICDILDAAPKGDMASMEHPVFSLSTKPDMRPREYDRNGLFLRVNPSQWGLATVFDRDILIYCISQCMAALNEGKPVAKTMRFKAHELLQATNRQTSGRGYDLLKDALRRLQGTQIETNMKNGGREHFSVFSLIDRAEIVRETRDGRMLDVEIELSNWVFDAIENEHVLTMSRQYFFLRKPLERRLYEIARKHCGAQSKWTIRLESLHEKAGSNSTLPEFRRLVGKIIADDEKHDHMPDYAFKLGDDDKIIIEPKKDNDQFQLGVHLGDLRLSDDAIATGRRLAAGWDIHGLEREWRQWVGMKGLSVKNPDSHFTAFCKKRGPYRT